MVGHTKKMYSRYRQFISHVKKTFHEMPETPIYRYISINSHVIRFAFANNSLVDIIMKPFNHIEIASPEKHLFNINLWDLESTRTVLRHDLVLNNDMDINNKNLFFNYENTHMLFNTLTSIMTLVDFNNHNAYYCIDSVDKMPDYEKAAPLRMFFHWFCNQNNMSLIHGAVIGIDGVGYLLAGKGGVGKSTLSILSYLNNFQLLGDDYIIIENRETPIAFSLYNSIKINQDIIYRYPYLHHYIVNPNPDKENKGFLFANDVSSLRMTPSIVLNGIILLTITSNDIPVFSKVPKIKALSIIGASTVYQMPGINRDFLTYIRNLVDNLQVYEYKLSASIEKNLVMLNEYTDINPLISVILPVCNGQQFISYSIESVLNQTHKNIELIVIDDGSTDQTKKLINQINDRRIKYIYQENQGPSAARNTGIKNSTGYYVAFIDHDDIWYQNKLARQLARLKNSFEFSLLYCRYNLVFEYPDKNYNWIKNIDGTLNTFYGIPSSLFVKRNVFYKLGLFNHNYKTGEDVDFLMRIKESCLNYTVLEETLFDKNIHDNNISKNIELSRKTLPVIFLNSIKRKKTLQNAKISVIIPSYNSDKHLISCIDSVLHQTFEPYEIIIADDGSTTNIRDLLSGYTDKRIKYFYQENKGISGARNLGIINASGDFLAFIDSDDMWTGEKLKTQIERLVLDYETDAVFGLVRQFYSKEVDTAYRNKYKFKDEPSQGLSTGTLLISRENYMKVGLFNENIKLGELFDWIHRFNTVGFKYTVIPEIMLYRRLHYNNNSIINKDDRKDFATVFAQIIKDKKKYERF